MKQTLPLFTIVIILIFRSSAFADDKTLKASEILTQSAAEKIIGQPLRLISDTSLIENGIHWRKCSYATLSKQQSSKHGTNFYFGIEEDSSVTQAWQIIRSIKKANMGNAPIEDLQGIGDEAFTEGSRPGLMMVRKGKFIFRYKISKPPETISVDELKAFAKRTADKY